MTGSDRHAVGHPWPVDARDLASWLAEAPPEMVVRLVADWIDKAVRLGLEAEVASPLDGRPHIDALVAAAVEYAADRRSEPHPGWTIDPRRESPVFWHPGTPSLLPNALVHAPAVFAIRGLLIEEDSLQCA